MPGKQSQISSASKPNRNKAKICVLCGKKETCHWAKHWARQHPGDEKLEWHGQSALQGQGWCTNWKEVALNGAKPVGILPQLQKGFTSSSSWVANAKRGSKSAINQPIPAFSAVGGNDDVEMENTIQEEEQVAVPGFGQLESNQILGKRSSTVGQPQLEQAVERELHPDDSVSLTGGASQTKRSDIQNQALPSNSNSKVAVKIPAPAVNQPRLTSKSLDKLPHSSVEQKQQMPKRDDKFLVPDPVIVTVYRNQGMRDQEAIQNIKVLNSKTSCGVTVRLLELIELVPFLTQPTISSYIELNKATLTSIRDLVLLAHTKAQALSVEEVTAITFVSVLFGGSVWASIPKMFSSLEPSKLKSVLDSLRPLMVAKFNENIVQWFCASWRYIEEQTLGLLRTLKESNLENVLSFDIATISRMVKIADVNQYLTVVKVFSKYPSFKLVMDAINEGSAMWKVEQKISFDEFVALIDFLTESENEHIIKANEDDLLESPLCDWMQKLKTLLTASIICNVGSVQHRLNELQKWYGDLLKLHQTDLRQSDPRYRRAFHGLTNGPNDLQFANAQYATLSLRSRSKQMWCIPSGQGKSRVLHTGAAILLLANSTTKIHLVYDSKQLMKRDQKEFKMWFTRLGLENAVEYHVGMDFQCNPTDVILVDEADELVFGNPEEFLNRTKDINCICLTATPDNEDSKGVEREVLKWMGFLSCDGLPETVVEGKLANAVTTVSKMKINDTLPFGAGPQLVSFIQQELKEHAVLLYCYPEFLELLITAKVPHILMADGENVDDEFLRTLDNRDPDGAHVLFVATSLFGMRGLDYRSLTKGVTLILAKSFANQRQAMQGLNRVGRFGDPCRRFILKDVALIDEQEEARYTASLIQFMQRHQRKTVMALLPTKKQTAAATTTTNPKSKKSTPACGKSQINRSSQSTFTAGAFGTTNLNQKQTRLANAIIQAKKANEKEEDGGQIMLTDSQLLWNQEQ